MIPMIMQGEYLALLQVIRSASVGWIFEILNGLLPEDRYKYMVEYDKIVNPHIVDMVSAASHVFVHPRVPRMYYRVGVSPEGEIVSTVTNQVQILPTMTYRYRGDFDYPGDLGQETEDMLNIQRFMFSDLDDASDDDYMSED